MTSRHSSLMGALMGLAAFGLYSCYDMTIKGLADRLDPMQVLFCACGLAAPMLLAQLMLMGQGGRALLPVLPGWTAIRVVVTLLNGTLGAYAFTLLPLAQCYAVFFLMPLLIAGLAVPLLGEPMDAARGLAILAGFAGVAVALQPGSVVLGLGHVVALASASLGACNYLIIRRTGHIERPGVLLLYPVLVQAMVSGIAMLWLWQPMTLAEAGLTLLMACELFVGGFLIITAYRIAPAIVVAPMQYSQILWAAVLGWLIFHEAISRTTALGILVIVAAGLFLLWRSAAPAPQAAGAP